MWQQEQHLQKRGWLPAGITVGEFVAATAAGLGLGGSIVQVMKAFEQREPVYDWDE